jgi:PrsW family intramembrane metalloprotease
MGPSYGPQQQAESFSPQQAGGQSRNDRDEDTQPRPIFSVPTQPLNYAEPVYREHVSGALYVHPSDAPFFQPVPYQGRPAPNQPAPEAIYNGSSYPGAGYSPQPGYYPQPGYGPQPGYSPQPGYYSQPYGWHPGYVSPYGMPWPPKPRRDGYLLGISIASFICTILVTLGGIGCLLFLTLFVVLGPRAHTSASTAFAGVVEFTALSIAGLAGGGFGIYHSIRALFFQKPSADFKLPWFWLFLIFYAIVLGIAIALRSAGLAVAIVPLTILLIALCGLLPAISVLALAMRRIHFPRQIRWPTNWRRLTLSMVAGATLAVVLAGVFELLLSALTAQALHVTNIQIDDPNAPLPTNLREIGFLVLLLSVIAPIIEESVKPLAIVVLIGRVRSAAEAFVLGMAGGIGFDLVETSGYMGTGYKNWVDVAVQRSAAGLLHGLGAGMVALGWYYITHRNSLKHRRILIALGCWIYAILQHAIWNGSTFLQILPGPIGHYLANGNINLGSISFPAFLLVYVLETVLMLLFLLFITKRLRPKMLKSIPEKKEVLQTQAQYTPVAFSGHP